MKSKVLLRSALAVLLILSLSLSLASCQEEKAHQYCELGIVLPRSFKKSKTQENFDLALSDGRIFVGMLRISLAAASEAQIPTTMSPLKLAEYYLDETFSGAVIPEIMTEGDIPYYSYTSGTDTKHLYVQTFYVTPYAYFIITFITPESTSEEILEEILGYASTVYMEI